jgi:hypothetical protein
MLNFQITILKNIQPKTHKEIYIYMQIADDLSPGVLHHLSFLMLNYYNFGLFVRFKFPNLQ